MLKISRTRISQILVSVMVVIFAFVTVTGLFGAQIGVAGPSEIERVVDIPAGSSVKKMSRLLTENNIIHNPTLFEWTVRILGLSSSLQAGRYVFPAHAPLKQVINKIATGEVQQLRLTIPEGFTNAQIVDLINSNENLTGEPLVATDYPEGSFLPETWAYTAGETRQQLAERMRAALQAKVDVIWSSRRADLPLSTPEEMLTLASIIEKETPIDAEKGMVAGVYINRLNQGMKLQADPTVIYGLVQEGVYDGNLRRSQLRDPKNPYNTYTIEGLPPTPIANAGELSLRAAVNPQPHNYLFFVADGKGGHIFSETYKQHKQAVDNYLKLLRNKS